MSKPPIELLLLSAGVESATLLHLLRERPLTALCVDYGQRAAAQELRHAQGLCERLDVPLRALPAACLGDAFRLDQSRKLHVPLPHRNLVLLAVAVSYAAQVGATRIHLAINRDDAEQHPSASQHFIAAFRATAETLAGPRIEAPLIDADKAEVVRRGAALGVDYTATYSCLLGYPRHCGSCPQCLSRRAAFARAGVVEPPDFYR